jgi:high-affinity iron transporter
MQIFLIISTCFLYLVAGGLFSRGIWYFQNNTWNKLVGGDTSETGSGAGSYDIRQSVWHVNCCNPEIGGGGGWGIFNALLGWTNSATLGSVIGYNLYWICVMVAYACMMYRERRGHLPYIDPAMQKVAVVKARGRAFVLRRPYEPYEEDTGPTVASGAVSNNVLSQEKNAGAEVSTTAKQSEA